MTDSTAPKRGRPPTITREAIAGAGIAMGLPGITFTGLARHLGVSHMALYKHVASIEALRTLVAEEIFRRWQLPLPDKTAGLEEYLQRLAAALWRLTRDNPGLASYLLDPNEITISMSEKIARHQHEVAASYGLSPRDARWLVFTVAYHAVAVAETVVQDSDMALVPSLEASGSGGSLGVAGGFAPGLRALIAGAIAMVD